MRFLEGEGCAGTGRGRSGCFQNGTPGDKVLFNSQWKDYLLELLSQNVLGG